MQDPKQLFAEKLRQAMVAAGYEPKPSVLEREFNTRHWGKPMTLHGVRRWLLGETMPDARKLITLAEWLRMPVQELAFGTPTPQAREEAARWHVGLGYEDRELFETYLKLPVPKRRLAREVILAIAKAHAADQTPRGNR
ncbi:XRE family transcriptional regulator [Acidovorax sp. NCPPB 3576]|uniref:XRE family transcriptional regulator n=1 Tax=Acidovorax sp. NCPPB 3576 TaxID=2940488 RepID=UPI00234BEB67|nr:XRE family transcriptional regulator [Acidovorax sp. NCPPB 3576]WCM87798.1 XRE family transcriptional regulator [Acidovorax sp. NCPPB 3576]